MQELRHRVVMLRAMRAGASGFARVQCEGGHTQLQLNARGLAVAGAQVFWYAGAGEIRLLGSAKTNVHGEICLMADVPHTSLAPQRLEALLVLSTEARPAPLLIGLCVQQSAGSLMDAKNAALALCEKLARQNATEQRKRKETEKNAAAQGQAAANKPQPATVSASKAGLPAAAPGAKTAAQTAQVAAPQTAVSAGPRAAAPQGSAQADPTPVPARPKAPEVPREIFLPAIDPLPYITAGQRDADAPPAFAPSAQLSPELPAAPRTAAPPVDRLAPLRWPRGFEPLKPYFAHGMPCRPLALPGWRFVRAADGLFLGYWAADGRVRRVAYAYPGSAPKGMEALCRPARGTDGQPYQVLWQQV